jgi:hypothetical protein
MAHRRPQGSSLQLHGPLAQVPNFGSSDGTGVSVKGRLSLHTALVTPWYRGC